MVGGHQQVLCAAWTADGQHLALGMYSGHISICNKSGTQQVSMFVCLVQLLCFQSWFPCDNNNTPRIPFWNHALLNLFTVTPHSSWMPQPFSIWLFVNGLRVFKVGLYHKHVCCVQPDTCTSNILPPFSLVFIIRKTRFGNTWVLFEQQLTIERSAPVWTLQWNTTQHKTSDALAVGCWDGTLSIYDLAGKQVCLITTLRQFITHAVLLHKLLQWKSNLCEHWVVAKNWFSDFTSMDDLIRWGMTRSLDLIHVVSPTMMQCTFVWVDQIKRSALWLSFHSSQESSFCS